VKFLEAVGGSVIRGFAYIGGLTIQFGSGLRASPHVLPFVGKRGRWRETLRQMAVVGVDALPMVGIMSLCVGFILALQMGAELRKLGALQYVIDTVALGFTRELGPLLTAFIVSGRSGSAFSAEIGTMVVTNEVDALRTMALDPIEFVLAPRCIASMIMIPCLSIMSNVFGILAGAAFMYAAMNFRLTMYLQYVANVIYLRDVLAGLLKSLVFAIIIANVGCMEGFRVRGGPDAVGRSATSAVVWSTFFVILADVFFTAVFYMIHFD
jgi:phospholipid/cholesterol/gamma-HCH transport system permease protein